MAVRKVIVGQDVFDAQQARKIAALGNGPIYNGDMISAWQVTEGGRGIVEAELVKSSYGWSVRYASGLYNFGLIASARSIGGTLEGAIEYATRWQAQAPSQRYVTMMEA